MRGDTVPLTTLLNQPRPEPLYLDGSMWEPFVDWIEPRDATDTSRIQALTTGSLNIFVFKVQLDSVSGIDKARDNRLKRAGVNIIPKKSRGSISPNDEIFIEEVLRIYFNNQPGARRQAELLLLARRHSNRTDRRVNVISQHTSFDRIPDVNRFHFLNLAPIGEGEPPADFDFLQDFGIHLEVEKAIKDLLDGQNHAFAIRAAYDAFEIFLKNKISSPQDAGKLMSHALNPVEHYVNHKNKVSRRFKMPQHRVNPLKDQDIRHTQVNEQEAFYLFAMGLVKLIRHPLSHQGGLQNQYAQTRFKDKITVLKLAAFISYLCERIDEGALP